MISSFSDQPISFLDLGPFLKLAVVFTTGVWLFNTGFNVSHFEVIQFGVIGLLIVFALFIGFSRFKSERRGEPAEDDLARKTGVRRETIVFLERGNIILL